MACAKCGNKKDEKKDTPKVGAKKEDKPAPKKK
jgi:hypothetical protein